ncbi:MAG: ABC transporter ATP-binding protein [bacterium]|nr:ABC transporter ATP-binding protein [bacterium]
MQSKEKNKDQKKEIRKGLKAIWRHIKPFKGQLVLLVVLGLISAVANGFVPYVTGRFLDTLIAISQGRIDSGFKEFPVWMIFLAIWAFIQFVATNNDWAMDRLSRKVENMVHFNLHAQGFIHFLHLPLNYHKNAHINGEMQKISQAGWRINSIIRTFLSITPQFLSIVIGITLAASINTTLAWVLLTGVIVYSLLLIKILLPMAEIDSKAHRVWSDAWDDSAAAVQQIESVKQAAAEEYEGNKTEEAFMVRSYKLWYLVEKHWGDVGFFQRLIVFFTQLAIFILSVRFISQGVITVGELVALNGYAAMFFGPFVQLGYNWQVIQNGITAAAHAEEIFDTPSENYVPKNAVPLGQIKGEIAFENVSFHYAPGQPEVLNKINFKVNPGEVVAFVGESGVGKSTSISLISGYYFPSEGHVLVDGVETQKINLHELRSQIAVVPQEVALFNDTIKANIRYGSFESSDEDVRRVAKEAHIDEFISSLPEGYETLVGERGIKLSVGQKQRVSIARAMLRDPAILILDEPTSALDAHTEQIVSEALEKLMRERTTFIIAHRLSTVRKADTILVFQKGQIVETGKHEALIKKEDGVYRHLYEYQVGLH